MGSQRVVPDALGGRFNTNPTHKRTIPDKNVRSPMPVVGGWCSSRLGRSRVFERDRDCEVSRTRASPFQEDCPANPSVRSMTSSVDVASAGDTDLEGFTLRLGCGLFSSSSEEMTYVTRDGNLRRSSVSYTTMKPTSMHWSEDGRLEHSEQRQVENLTAPR